MAGEFRQRDRGASRGKLLSCSHAGRGNHTLLSWCRYGCLVPARQRDGSTCRAGETPYERSHRCAYFWEKTRTTLVRYARSEEGLNKMNVLTKTLRIAAALLLGTSGCSRKAEQVAPPTPEVLVTTVMPKDVPVWKEAVGA